VFFRSSKVTDAGLKYVMAMKHLESFALNVSQVSHAGKEALERALARCKVYLYPR
jgi:hypothetical protein